MTDLPTVWRRVIIPAYITFEQLHRVIQHVMPWQDYHLYYFSASDDNSQFTNDQDGIGEYEYYRKNPAALEGMKDWDKAFFSEPRKAAWEVKIGPVLEKAGALDYVYDFGDHWEH